MTTFKHWKAEASKAVHCNTLRDCVAAWESERMQLEQRIAELGEEAIVTESRFDDWNAERREYEQRISILQKELNRYRGSVLKNNGTVTSEDL